MHGLLIQICHLWTSAQLTQLLMFLQGINESIISVISSPHQLLRTMDGFIWICVAMTLGAVLLTQTEYHK